MQSVEVSEKPMSLMASLNGSDVPSFPAAVAAGCFQHPQTKSHKASGSFGMSSLWLADERSTSLLSSVSCRAPLPQEPTNSARPSRESCGLRGDCAG